MNPLRSTRAEQTFSGPRYFLDPAHAAVKRGRLRPQLAYLATRPASRGRKRARSRVRSPRLAQQRWPRARHSRAGMRRAEAEPHGRHTNACLTGDTSLRERVLRRRRQAWVDARRRAGERSRVDDDNGRGAPREAGAHAGIHDRSPRICGHARRGRRPGAERERSGETRWCGGAARARMAHARACEGYGDVWCC